MYDYILVVAAIVFLCIAADITGIPWYVPLIVVVLVGIGQGLGRMIEYSIENPRK